MRELSQQIKNSIKQGAPILYCFTISSKSFGRIHLNSSDRVIHHEGINFLPNSGLEVQEMKFDDNAQNYVTITGIYEDAGITKNLDLTGSKFKIFLYCGRLHHLLTYQCAYMDEYDLSFKLTLHPESMQLHRPLLKRVSKTCRARLGDNECKVAMQNYSTLGEIESISGSRVILKNLGKERGDNYFTFGRAVFGEKISCTIKSHIGKTIEIDGNSDNISGYDWVTLYAGCDKEFTTCCNKFKNSINFRGEPFLPDYKSIKIL